MANLTRSSNKASQVRWDGSGAAGQLGSLAAWQLGSLAAWQLGSMADGQLGSIGSICFVC